jgi:hypothetical protein
MTALGAIMAVADMLILRHPETMKIVRSTLAELDKAKNLGGGGA